MEPQRKRHFGCDESKCVAFGGWNNVTVLGLPFVNPFTCYGDDGGWYPRACADGFVPVVVDDEPGIRSADWDGNMDESHAVDVSYFTCCPPTEASDTNGDVFVRQCSNPMIVPLGDETDIDAICSSEETRIYPRQMKTNWMTTAMGLSYQCCDSPLTNSTLHSNENGANFLDDTECVPYNSDYYGQAATNNVNVFGRIVAVTCDFSDGSFSFPRPSSTGGYECCKNGPATPPFIQDSVFKLQIYPHLIFTTIGVITSLILIFGLLIPLWTELRQKKKFERRPSRSSSNLSLSSSRRSRRRSTYNPCNLYLVYLGVLDLAYCLKGVIKYGSFVNQKLISGDPSLGPPPHSSPLASFNVLFMVDNVIDPPYLIANLYLNAIVCYQVLLLLKSSKHMQKVQPPSLRRVSLQGGAVCFLALAYSLTLVFIRNYCKRAAESGDLMTPANISLKTYQVASWMALPPFAYVLYSVFLIWWRGYMPSLRRTRSSGQDSSNYAMIAVRNQAIRGLGLYLLRIVFIYLAFFIPSTVLAYSAKTHLELGRNYTISQWLVAIQPTATFCVILSKSDVRNHIWDFITLSFLTKQKASQSSGQSTAFFSRYGNSLKSSSNGRSQSELFVADAIEKSDGDIGGIDISVDAELVSAPDKGNDDYDVENSAVNNSITDESRSTRHIDGESKCDSDTTKVES